MKYVDLRPDDVRQVQVLVGDTWLEGDLEAYDQSTDGAWRGWVRWSARVGQTYLGWFTEDHLRRPGGHVG